MLSLSSKKIIHRVTHASNVHTHTLDGCACTFDGVKNVNTDERTRQFYEQDGHNDQNCGIADDNNIFKLHNNAMVTMAMAVAMCTCTTRGHS